MGEREVITTIIPTYRRPATLERAIYSALNQTYTHVKVVVYDDASNDETDSLVKAIANRDSRVVYVRNKENLGATNTFRRGLSEVSTEFFSFLSDDDVLLPTFYERALKEFVKWPNAQASCGITWVVTPEGSVLSNPTEWISQGYYPAPSALQEMLKHRHREWTGMLFKNAVMRIVDAIDSRTAVPDFDYVLRCSAVCDIAVYDEPVALFVAHPGSSTARFSRRFVYPSYCLLADRLYKEDRLQEPFRVWCRNILEQKVDRHLVIDALKAISANDFGEARAICHIMERDRKATSFWRVVRFVLDTPPCFVLMKWVLRALVAVRHNAKRFSLTSGGKRPFVHLYYARELGIPKANTVSESIVY